MDWRAVFVSMSCPFVPVEDITTSLKRSCELRGEMPGKVLDTEKVWNGVWKYTARLFIREGRMVHIRPDLMIGAVRGSVFYRGQPRTCFKCNSTGHLAAECEEVVCKNCRQTGHVSRDCPSSVVCNLCGSEEHLYRDCPQ
ncbi:ZCHC3 protein, partial [Polyodon spathula]|nr:ZCHC3 protein [Polyodon spathula]